MFPVGKAALRGSRWQAVLGDYREAFVESHRQMSTFRAVLAVLWDALQSLGILFKERINGSFGMFKNFLQTAVRVIRRNVRFSLLNLGGLALGLGCVILLTLYIDSELKFDRYHVKADRIYRLGAHIQIGERDIISGASNAPAGPYLVQNEPEVEAVARFKWFSGAAVTVGDQKYQEYNVYYSDPSALDIFTWPLIQGDAATALAAPYSIVLSRELATKYFGDVNPVGQSLTIGNNQPYQVTGVMEDVPFYSTLSPTALVSFSTLEAQVGMADPLMTEWTSFNFNTYVLVRVGSDASVLESRIQNLLHEKDGEALAAKGATETLFLEPLRDIYLRPLGQSTGPATYIWVFSAATVLILVMAIFNFMNLSTARAVTRAREVGVRKTLGASRQGILWQFLSEALFMSTVAALLALLLALLALPMIRQLTQRPLGLDFIGMPLLGPGLVLLVLFTGLASGLYPALLLSRFQPGQILRSRSRGGAAGTQLRRVLVFIQFAISTGLLIGTGLIVLQLDYMRHKDLGFDKDQVLVCYLNSPQSRKALPVLKQAFAALDGVSRVAASSVVPGGGAPTNDKLPEGFPRSQTQLMEDVNMDEDILDALGLTLVAGEGFAPAGEKSNLESVLINETAAKTFGWSDPVGKHIWTPDYHNLGRFVSKEVVGVIQDFHLFPVTQSFRPMIISYDPEMPLSWGDWDRLILRLQGRDLQAVVKAVEKAWAEVLPGERFSARFLDEVFDRQFTQIERSRNLFSYFSVIALLVAALGLLGMAMLNAEQRIKEIGIRKVLGSSVRGLVLHLSREMLVLVVAANALAWPVVFVLIRDWLGGFPYHVGLTLWPFVLGALFVLVLSFMTIASQTVKAALANPVKALKYE